MAQALKSPLPVDQSIPDQPRQPDPSRALHSGVDIGEYLSVDQDPDEIEIQDAPDGGAYVMGAPAESTPPDLEFYSNLALVLPQQVQDRIVTDLLRRIEDDKDSRKKRDEQYEEGIRRTGLGNDAPGGAEFEGASRVVHPMMTEACIDYESRIIKEIFPPSGPVKPHVEGVATPEKTARAERVAAHMNWQIRSQIKEARATLETTLTQVPLGGSQFVRQWQDHRLKRPRWEFVSVDRVYIPSNAADFSSAHRKTVSDTISAVEIKMRIDQGMYVDIGAPTSATPPEPTKAEKASQRVQGVDDNSTNLDGDREIFETMSFLEITEDMADLLGREKPGELYPYLITIDVQTKKMLAAYRDWEENDPTREPIEHVFEFPFIPWRGALSIGFPQIIGGLSAAATGALRALLDSAHANNASGGLILKGSGAGGQTVRPSIGEFTEIDGGLETDDIRKKVMPFSISQPSPVLFQLLGFVVDAARGVVRTSIDEAPTGGQSPNTPVGTRLSFVEEGLVVFSAIHGRAHAAMNRLIAGLFRLNRLYLPETLKVEGDGQELLVRRADYMGSCAVQPVSDPTIYSDQQRWAQLGYIQQRMMVAPQLWKAREVELMGLKLIKIPDPESLLVDHPDPQELNAVNENLAICLGRPVDVFTEQNHLAHIQVHLDFMRSPALGANPLIAPAFLPAALKHVAEHIVYAYVQGTTMLIKQTSGHDAADLLSNDARVKGMYDQLLATASQHVVPSLENLMHGAMPVLMQAQQLLKQLQPPPPMDPAMAAVQAAAAETARKSHADQIGAQQDQVDATTKAQLQSQANAIAAERNRILQQGQQIAAQTKMQTTQMDNDTAEQIASTKLASGSTTQLTDGGSLAGQG